MFAKAWEEGGDACEDNVAGEKKNRAKAKTQIAEDQQVSSLAEIHPLMGASSEFQQIHFAPFLSLASLIAFVPLHSSGNSGWFLRFYIIPDLLP